MEHNSITHIMPCPLTLADHDIDLTYRIFHVVLQSMLAHNRFDPEGLTRVVNAVQLRGGYQPLQPLGETDIEVWRCPCCFRLVLSWESLSVGEIGGVVAVRLVRQRRTAVTTAG